ncbi:IPT/TIG domain-containing protein, partial [Candidatus Cyanaurora vandensis]
RSNNTPLSLAPQITAVNPPVLTPAGDGTYTLSGSGFSSGQTELLLETVALTETAASPPSAGEFRVTPTTLQFVSPNLAPGPYAVRVRVSQVEALPAWWVVLP